MLTCLLLLVVAAGSLAVMPFTFEAALFALTFSSVFAWNIGLLLRAEEMPPEALRLEPMPQLVRVLLLTLMLRPGASPLAGVVLGLICTEPLAVDRPDVPDSAGLERAVLNGLCDWAGILVGAGLDMPRACLVGKLLLGDITVTLLLDKFALEDALAGALLDTLALGVALATLLAETLGLDTAGALLLTDL